MQKILIAHTSEVFVTAMAERLQNAYTVCYCDMDTDPLILIEDLQPGILVIYLPLLYRRGILSLNETVYHPPVILGLTNIVTDDICRDAAAAGINELITIPCTVDHAVARLKSLVNKKNPSRD